MRLEIFDFALTRVFVDFIGVLCADIDEHEELRESEKSPSIDERGNMSKTPQTFDNESRDEDLRISGTIFSSKCSIAMEEMSRSSCRIS